MARVFIGMGSNLGDREARLAEALEALDRIDGSRLARASRFYETEPVGGPPQGPYRMPWRSSRARSPHWPCSRHFSRSSPLRAARGTER